ncbi:hypothetical protein KCU60_g3, partial [Aureobasidium melanogenum]
LAPLDRLLQPRLLTLVPLQTLEFLVRVSLLGYELHEYIFIEIRMNHHPLSPFSSHCIIIGAGELKSSQPPDSVESDAKRNRAGDAKSPRHRAQSEASERRLHSSNLNNDSRTCKMALWAPLTLCRFSDRAIMHSGLRSSLRSLR